MTKKPKAKRFVHRLNSKINPYPKLHFFDKKSALRIPFNECRIILEQLLILLIVLDRSSKS